VISEKLTASKANSLLNQSKSMTIERHDQELSLDQLGAISAGIRFGFVVGPIALKDVRRPKWVRPTGFDVGPIGTPRRHL